MNAMSQAAARKRLAIKRALASFAAAVRPSPPGGPRPRLPHEHDESVDSQARTVAQGGIAQRAYDDLRAGRVDTGWGPVVERTYRRLKQSAR